MVERVPYRECVALKGTVDVFFDQVTFGYGNNSLEAFAMGIPVISGADDPRVLETMKGLLGELPFYPATRADLMLRLAEMIESEELRREVGARGRAYVTRFHSLPAVADRMKRIYADRLEGRMKPRCPMCGAEDYRCGEANHTPIAVDAPMDRRARVGGPDLVKVEVRRGVVMKLTPEEAAHYGQGPLAVALRVAESATEAAATPKRRTSRNKKRDAEDKTFEDPALD